MVSAQPVAAACAPCQEEEKKNPVDNGDVSDAESVYSQACEAVMGINKRCITELKALNNPHPVVLKVISVAGAVLGQDCSDWIQCKKLMKDPAKFQQSLVYIDVDKLDKKTIRKLKAMVNEFTVQDVMQKSMAAGEIYSWLSALYQYVGEKQAA